MGIITRDKSLGLSGVIVFTGYETSALLWQLCLFTGPS